MQGKPLPKLPASIPSHKAAAQLPAPFSVAVAKVSTVLLLSLVGVHLCALTDVHAPLPPSPTTMLHLCLPVP